MLYAHIIEAMGKKGPCYVVHYNDFCEFDSIEDRMELAPHIRWTFREPSGVRAELNRQIADWAREHNVAVSGVPPTATFFALDEASYVCQLKLRIEEMAALLQERQNKAEEAAAAAGEKSKLDGTECKAHEDLEELQGIVQYAIEQKGCTHIPAAIKELKEGGQDGH